jgi:hypothetical protein
LQIWKLCISENENVWVKQQNVHPETKEQSKKYIPLIPSPKERSFSEINPWEQDGIILRDSLEQNRGTSMCNTLSSKGNTLLGEQGSRSETPLDTLQK